MKNWKTFLGGILAGLLLTGLFRFITLPRNQQTFKLATVTADLSPKPEATTSLVHVHVAGAVVNPGVYGLPEGAYLQQAIDAANGTLPGARTDLLNLAALLIDGQRVYVPSQDEQTELESNQRSMEIEAGGTININTASLEELVSLPGIGEVRAKAIIAYRTENGYFMTIEDLLKVNGIGSVTFEEIREYITVSP